MTVFAGLSEFPRTTPWTVFCHNQSEVNRSYFGKSYMENLVNGNEDYFLIWGHLRQVCNNRSDDIKLFAESYKLHSKVQNTREWFCPGSLSLLVLVIRYKDSGQTSAITLHLWTFKKSSITKTRLYNFDPLKPHFYIVKLGFTGVYIIFLISVQKHRLWVLVRTASPRRF